MKIPIVSDLIEQREIDNFIGKFNFDRIYDRAVLSHGDQARLVNVFIKAKGKKSITIGAIGGSITQGSAATREKWRWINLVLEWWKRKFPETEFLLVNAGLSATNSLYGSHRLQDDVLVYKPDFVIIEFSVNDMNEPIFGETMEGLVRQILKCQNQPAILLLIMGKENGASAQEFHSQVGKHYELPMISYVDAVFPMLNTGELRKGRLSNDGLHPNNLGHNFCGTLINLYLQNALGKASWPLSTNKFADIPEPLFSNTFEETTRYNADRIIPELNSGWKKVGTRWVADEPGSELSFRIRGRCFSVAFYRVKGNMGMVEVIVDQNQPVTLDSWYQADWGGYPNTVLVSKDLEPDFHRINIRLLDTKAEESNGHHFEIIEILSAGMAEY